MTYLSFLVLALAFAVVWLFFGRRTSDRRTRLGNGQGEGARTRRNADMETAEELIPLRRILTPEERGKILQFRKLRRSADRDEGPETEETAGEDRVVAMVRNPRSLYVYWELEGNGEQDLRRMLGEKAWKESVPCLRLFDVTKGAYPGMGRDHTFARDLSEHDDHAFLSEQIEPGHRYVVSYERRTKDGRYYLVAHSDPVVTPFAGPATEDALYRMYGHQPGQWSGSPWR